MIRNRESRCRRFIVAGSLLGFAIIAGCESKPPTPDGPPAVLQPKIKRLQDVKSKSDASKKETN